MVVRRLLARLRRLYADYRALRWALWALGAVASVGGTIVGALAADAWRRMGPVLTDSPEYASDAKASPPLASIHWSLPHVDLGPFVPLLIALAVVLTVRVLLRWPMARPDNPWERDPKRLFTDADRRWIKELTGNRCEHRWMFGLLRCRRRGAYMDGHGQMDHHYPHAKGGATVRTNLVWLCDRHNNRKSDKVPTRLETWMLYRARLKYLPARWRAYARIDATTDETEEDDDDGQERHEPQARGTARGRTIRRRDGGGVGRRPVPARDRAPEEPPQEP